MEAPGHQLFIYSLAIIVIGALLKHRLVVRRLVVLVSLSPENCQASVSSNVIVGDVSVPCR